MSEVLMFWFIFENCLDHHLLKRQFRKSTPAQEFAHKKHPHTPTLDTHFSFDLLCGNLALMFTCSRYVGRIVDAHLQICTCVFMLSLMSSSWDTMGAHPLYLFVRQPDESNWQSYIIISQRLCFTPGAGMRGIVDSCRREDNWVN